MFHYCFITSYQRVNYLSENQRITKGNYQSLIIWRSLVQAQAGPQRKEALIAINQAVSAFLFVLHYELG